MAMDYARKALDSVVGANYERKDLSPVITMQNGPQRPLLRALGTTRAKGKTHYWDEVALNAVGQGAASYAEGAKPNGDTNTPQQLSNVVCRIGKVAQVTDTLAAIWTGAGAYTLKDGELERLYQEAIDFQTGLKTTEVLNEVEWMLVNGNSANPQGFAGGQCDGILQRITTNATSLATGTVPFAISNTANAAAYEAAIRALALQIRALYTPTVPTHMLATSGQKQLINAFVGGGAGRPVVQIVSQDSAGYVAGQEVDEYQTGFFKVSVQIEPFMELGSLPTGTTTCSTVLLDGNHFSVAYLIPLGAEPLARINTTIERMVTVEFTLEVRNQKSSGKLIGLSA